MVEPKQFVRGEGGRGIEDREALAEARDTHTCPFCRIRDGQENPDTQCIVLQTDHWCVIENIKPEEFSLLHLVVFSVEHPDSGRYRDLSQAAKCSAEEVLEEAIDAYCGKCGIDLEEWQYSIFSRRGTGGEHNAQTVFHPSFHIIASDGLNMLAEDIPHEFGELLELKRLMIISVFRRENPELYEYMMQEKGLAAVWSEARKYFQRAIGLHRSLTDGKAGEIRPKLSNRATEER